MQCYASCDVISITANKILSGMQIAVVIEMQIDSTEMHICGCSYFSLLIWPGPRLNIKTIFPRYGDYHVKDKTVVRPPYL